MAELKPFLDNPFKVQQDEETDRLCRSIKEYGVLSSPMARLVEGGYEIVSGNRRKVAAELMGMEKLPVLVWDMTDDKAVILMVDSNIQREDLLPSEKAFAYKLKLKALKHQEKRTDLTSPQLAAKFRTDDVIAKGAQISGDTIRRYIRLTELVPPLSELVDQKRIALLYPPDRTCPAAVGAGGSKTYRLAISA